MRDFFSRRGGDVRSARSSTTRLLRATRHRSRVLSCCRSREGSAPSRGSPRLKRRCVSGRAAALRVLVMSSRRLCGCARTASRSSSLGRLVPLARGWLCLLGSAACARRSIARMASCAVIGLAVALALAVAGLLAAVFVALGYRRRLRLLLAASVEAPRHGHIALSRSPTRSDVDSSSFVRVETPRPFVLPSLRLGSDAGLLDAHDTSSGTNRPPSPDQPTITRSPSYELSSGTIRAPSRSMIAVPSTETSASPTASEPPTPTRSRHRAESGRSRGGGLSGTASRKSTSTRPSIGSLRAGLEVRRPVSSQTFGASD